MEYLCHDATWSEIYEHIKPYTLVPEPAVRFYVNAVLGCIKQEIPGVIVECGCWFAGASLAVCFAQQHLWGEVKKPVYLLDKFLGFEEPCTKDGNYTFVVKKNISEINFSEQAQAFFDYAVKQSASLSAKTVADLYVSHGLLVGRDIFIHEGWVKDTVPPLIQELATTGISLLRLDVDLYEATRQCFALEALVADRGLVLIDDYYHFDGCATAVHEFLALPENPYKLRGQPGQGVFYEKRRPKSFEFVPEWVYLQGIC